MPNKFGQTAGDLSKKAMSDKTKYDPLEIGYEMTKDLEKHIFECIDNHKDIFHELDQFCVVMLLVHDEIIKNAIRRKFYAWPFLPDPRPGQTCFLYDKRSEQVSMLWALPAAHAMAALSTLISVDDDWKRMQRWSRAFYEHKFHELIRKENSINILSEKEWLKTNRKEVSESGLDELDPFASETFDFSKVFAEKVEEPNESFSVKNIIDTGGET